MGSARLLLGHPVLCLCCNGFLFLSTEYYYLGWCWVVELDYSLVVPEDVLRDVLEAEEEFRVKKRLRKRFPSSRDIVYAVLEAIHRAYGIHPDEFPDLVYSILEGKGFSTKHVTVKRIWRVYEKLVRSHVAPDVLNVVVDKD